LVWKFEGAEIRDAAGWCGRNRDAGTTLQILIPRSPDGYQNKGVANWQKWMVVKTKGIGKLAQIGKNEELGRVGGGGGE
jgi:hypothetical protein